MALYLRRLLPLKHSFSCDRCLPIIRGSRCGRFLSYQYLEKIMNDTAVQIASILFGAGGIVVAFLSYIGNKNAKTMDERARVMETLQQTVKDQQEKIDEHDEAIEAWRTRQNDPYNKYQIVLSENWDLKRQNQDFKDAKEEAEIKYAQQLEINKGLSEKINTVVAQNTTVIKQNAVLTEKITTMEAAAHTLETKVDANFHASS